MPDAHAKGEERFDENTITGPSDYDPSSRPTVTLAELVSIPNTNRAQATIADTTSGGRAFLAEVASVNGNVVVVEVYDTGSASGGDTGSEVASGTDLSNTTIKVQGRGF